jgi:tRNA modification GTPase
VDTIFALATARGRAGVAVIRLSGPDAIATARRLCPGSDFKLRQASLRRIVHLGQVLDEALVICFGVGASFTGEESVEFQVHGSSAVINSVLTVLGETPGLRIAEPGEFTRRAMMNGVMDLSQVEGLADLLAAETESQRQQAQAVLGGAISRKVARWRHLAVRAAALVEATIDFADEDVPVNVWPEVAVLVEELRCSLAGELSGARAAERIREGFEVAIVGAPNVGKSTLLNALAGRDVAITSVHAGTTRDVIEVRMDVAGLAVTFLDTAGIRDTDDPIEREGIRRALLRADGADMRIFLLSDDGEMPPLVAKVDDLMVVGKADLGGMGRNRVSGVTGEGVDELLGRVSDTLARRVAGSGLLNRARHRGAANRALVSLENVAANLLHGIGNPEIVAFEIRDVIAALEFLVGKIGVEDLLGEIFSSFCIGK